MSTCPLSFSLSLPNRAVLFGLSTETLLKTAAAAEASGASLVWVGATAFSPPARIDRPALRYRPRAPAGSSSARFAWPVPYATRCSSRSSGPVSICSRAVGPLLAVCIGKSANDGPTAAAELAAFPGSLSAERAGRFEEEALSCCVVSGVPRR